MSRKTKVPPVLYPIHLDSHFPNHLARHPSSPPSPCGHQPHPAPMQNFTSRNFAFSAVSAYLCRTKFVVVSNKLTPLFWDRDIIIAYMLEMVLQGAVNVPILLCHIE